MIRFENFEDLLGVSGLGFAYKEYLYQELRNYEGCVGSIFVENIEDEPVGERGFTVEFNSVEFTVYPTVSDISEDEFILNYWLEFNLTGAKWEDLKDILVLFNDFTYLDKENFDYENMKCIVDFTGIYSDYSIIGRLEKYLDGSFGIEIDDEAEVYRSTL